MTNLSDLEGSQRSDSQRANSDIDYLFDKLNYDFDQI